MIDNKRVQLIHDNIKRICREAGSSDFVESVLHEFVNDQQTRIEELERMHRDAWPEPPTEAQLPAAIEVRRTEYTPDGHPVQVVDTKPAAQRPAVSDEDIEKAAHAINDLGIPWLDWGHCIAAAKAALQPGGEHD